MTETRVNPWYVLGTELDDTYTVTDALNMVDGDDFVQPADLYTINDNFVGSFPQYIEGPQEQQYVAVVSMEQVEGSIGIKSNIYGTMSTCGPNYEIIQRREALELAYEISGFSGGDALVKSIGHLGPRAQKFFAYLELPTLVIDPNGIADEIIRGMYVATSFDGSIATTIGESDMRPSCTNMIHMALRKLERPIRVHHRRNAEERLRSAAKAWEYAGTVEKEKLKACEKMLRVDGNKALQTVKDHFWPVDDPDLPDSTRTKRATARDHITQLYGDSDGTAAELVGYNGYAVFQAYTEYMDHYRPVRIGSNGVGERARRSENSVLPGTVITNKIRASELITALAA